MLNRQWGHACHICPSLLQYISSRLNQSHSISISSSLCVSSWQGSLSNWIRLDSITMGLKWALVPALALVLALSCTCVCAAGGRRAELQLEEPREILQTDGGRIEAWSNIRSLRDANVAAARFTIKQRGLVLPKYSDSACIGYVEDGEGYAGILTGYSLGESSGVRRVRRGDIVAFPRGVASWWYNSGNSELRILGLAETSAGYEADEPTGFFLIGGGREGGSEHGREHERLREGQQEFRGILHGFRKQFLADAWDVDESQVDELLRSQHGVGIVQAERDVRIEESRANSVQDSQTHLREHIANGEFVYNIREGAADVRVRNAGLYNTANRFKLPILRDLNLGASYGRLEPNAILAPQWSLNGHIIVHILRGSARLEIASNDGERLVSQDINEGDAYVVPRFYPHGVQAGQEGLEWIAFHTTDQPLAEALAGRTSALRNLPAEVAAAAFNVDVEEIRQIQERRGERPAFLLPGRRSERHNFDSSFLRYFKSSK